jgi:hypothetical protein
MSENCTLYTAVVIVYNIKLVGWNEIAVHNIQTSHQFNKLCPKNGIKDIFVFVVQNQWRSFDRSS